MTGRARTGRALFFGVLATASLTVLSRADAALGPTRAERAAVGTVPKVSLAGSARGRSRSVHMVTTLPESTIALALELAGSPDGLSYEWVELGSDVSASAPRSLTGPILAPRAPGFFRLAIIRNTERRVVDSLTVAVLKPMTEKQGASINGYRIGFYGGERRGLTDGAPPGFLEISEEHASLPVSAHLKLSDFITHDAQTTWPRYVAMDPRLLDKLELVFAEIARWRGSPEGRPVDVDVHSGFRTPLYNRRVVRAASDSRHQYGDAADVAVDANGDGRITRADVGLIVRAVEEVERRHPELAGGLGIYSGGSAYAHIDVRGRAVRWRS